MMQDTQTLIMNWRSASLAMIMACTIITLIYLYVRNIERRAVAWLLACVVAGMVNAMPMVIGFAGAYDVWPGLTFLPTDMTLFFAPLLYYHATTLMNDHIVVQRRWLFLPGLIYFLYQTWAFLFLGDYEKKWAFNDAVHYPVIVPIVFFGALVLTIWLLIEIWRLRVQYLHWLENNRSDNASFDPIWLTHLMLIGTPLAAIWALESVLERALGLNYFESFWAELAILSLLFLISIEALARIQHPYPKMGMLHAGGRPDPEPTDRDWQREGAELKKAITENRWYLETRFSLQTLAKRFGMNQTYVSRALNRGLGVNFSALINGLRVEHAQGLIIDGELSMLDIALASGFGSKASFNRAFKLHSATTPSHFRDKEHVS